MFITVIYMCVSVCRHTYTEVYIYIDIDVDTGFPCSSVGKQSAYNAGNLGLIPGLGRFPREENGNPLRYSCLENPMDRGAWQAMVIYTHKYNMEYY